MPKVFTLRAIGRPRSSRPIYQDLTLFDLISINLPLVAKAVIPEEILIGNPASNRLQLWIPDKEIRG